MEGYTKVTFEEWLKAFFSGKTVNYYWFGKMGRDMTKNNIVWGCSFISFQMIDEALFYIKN